MKKGFTTGSCAAAAGKAAHLGGVLAAHTVLPVIGIPVKSSTLDGLDALLATVQMPSGIPVATVAIDGSANAALLAIQMLALSDEELSEKFAGEVKFCTVDTDTEKALRIRFAVAVAPYLVFIADGMQTPLFDELVTAERLEERIRFVLDGGEAPTTRPL